MGKDVVEKFATGGVFEDDAYVFIRFDDIVQSYDVGMFQSLKERLGRERGH